MKRAFNFAVLASVGVALVVLCACYSVEADQ